MTHPLPERDHTIGPTDEQSLRESQPASRSRAERERSLLLGCRSPQQRAVLRFLIEASSGVSAQRLHAQLRERGHRIGLNTVYRALNTFTEAGILDAIRSPHGYRLFQLRPEHGQHQDFLICRVCGYSIAIIADTIQRWVTTIGHHHNFTDLHYVIQLNGVCPTCTS